MITRGGFGPQDARIVCVGEAYGREEREHGRPFVGNAGKELRGWLAQAGIDPDSVYYTNVINKQPPGNNFKEFCLTKKQAKEEYAKWRDLLEMQAPNFPWPNSYEWKLIDTGAYLHPKHLHELPALYDEINAVNPNLIIPLGNKACWAILGQTKISKIRGAVAWSDACGRKCLPTLHPAAILRNYEQRPFCLADMMKAAEECKFPEIRRPERELWLDPDLDDLSLFDKILQQAGEIGCDIETAPEAGIIKTVGFSADESKAIVVPFFDPRTATGSYWPDVDSERLAWYFVERWLGFSQSKIFQNGAYDMTWLWVLAGMYPSEWEDTLLQAHSLQPELQKDLGTLGSIFTAEPAWKFEHHHSTNKDAE